MKAVETLLKKNKAIPSNATCPLLTATVHIPIKEGVNCYARQYPLSEIAHEEIEKQLSDWLKDEIVVECEPSQRFHLPLLAVPKHTEEGQPKKYRICCDLRRVNASIKETYQENFAIPKIQDIFNRVIRKGEIFTKIDLRQTYFSFPVAEDSQEVLTFSYNHHHYRWAHAPFGLSFMTSLFCYNMQVLLRDIEGVETYIDDCILYSSTIDEHIELINRVVDKLTSANLRINFEKSDWFQTSVFLLGFVVGPGITKIDTRRLSNIEEWKLPQSAAQVRSIMGVISHLRDYIPMLSKVDAPIDKLRTDDDVKNHWIERHTDCFNRI